MIEQRTEVKEDITEVSTDITEVPIDDNRGDDSSAVVDTHTRTGEVEQGSEDSNTPTEVRKGRRLTGKEQKYINAIAQGSTRRSAVRQAYDVKDDVSVKTLDNMAQRIEKRPEVLAVLQANELVAQEVVADVMNYSRELGKSGSKEGGQYARVALDGANSLLDRIHGKAKQSIDVQSTSVNINIDLTAI